MAILLTRQLKPRGPVKGPKGTSSWKEQFTEALTVSGGDEEDDAEGGGGGGGGGGGESSSPTPADYLMHSITIFWKVLFAFVPPTASEIACEPLPQCSLKKYAKIYKVQPLNKAHVLFSFAKALKRLSDIQLRD
ncbi:hypothetical protein HZH68_001283 [Vespula germanica]|uniref:Uncharacterized protein n=1 Tax=Vespula germanica TaxID=30212 RepID=A0A834NV61_VESGE|nr:hypothetical protein HZH68_001283 [Vespula germanica]